jgi:hypothetical protein
MKLSITCILFAALAILLLINACSPKGPLPSNPATGSAGTTANGKVKLSDTQDWANAHLISGDTLDAGAQSALSGFSLKKNPMPDGTVQITLTAAQAGYFNQTYNLKPGQQLYFIERFKADDSGGSDINSKDDSAVIVDAQGYIV